jgi:hypothetical protein
MSRETKIASIYHLHKLLDLIESLCLTFRIGYREKGPVTVAERSEAYTVFARSEAGTMGLNPTQGMDV